MGDWLRVHLPRNLCLRVRLRCAVVGGAKLALVVLAVTAFVSLWAGVALYHVYLRGTIPLRAQHLQLQGLHSAVEIENLPSGHVTITASDEHDAMVRWLATQK